MSSLCFNVTMHYFKEILLELGRGGVNVNISISEFSSGKGGGGGGGGGGSLAEMVVSQG